VIIEVAHGYEIVEKKSISWTGYRMGPCSHDLYMALCTWLLALARKAALCAATILGQHWTLSMRASPLRVSVLRLVSGFLGLSSTESESIQARLTRKGLLAPGSRHRLWRV
jgi:hypothetical protein